METKTLLVYSTKDTKKGKLAITSYDKLKENKDWEIKKS